MKNLRLKNIIVSLILFTSIHTHAQIEWTWKEYGLNDMEITCMQTHDNQRVLAGTESGLYLNTGNRKWEEILSLPVKAIEEVDSLTIVVGVSDSQNRIMYGRYIGNDSTSYNFSDAGSIPDYQSITAGTVNNQHVVLFGFSDDIYMRSLPGGAMIKILTPPDCFGDRDPFCSVLHIVENDNVILAGGYDLKDISKGMILQMIDSQFVQISTQKPLVMKEIRGIDMVILDTGTYISTIDSGLSRIISYDPFLTENIGTEDITQIIDISIINICDLFCFCVLTDEISYYLRDQDWWDMINPGDSRKFICLSDYSIDEYGFGYAGTDMGVCKLYLPDQKKISQAAIAPHNIKLTVCQKQLFIHYNSPVSQYFKMDIFDISGKRVAQLYSGFISKGSHHIKCNHKIADGIYLLQLKGKNFNIRKKFILN